MSFPGTLIRPAFAIVALVAGTNAAAYWTVYTMDRLETAAGSALLSLPGLIDAGIRRLAAPAVDGGDGPGAPPALPYEQRDDHDALGVEVPVDSGLGCTTDQW
jgi:hypothetical protein